MEQVLFFSALEGAQDYTYKQHQIIKGAEKNNKKKHNVHLKNWPNNSKQVKR